MTVSKSSSDIELLFEAVRLLASQAEYEKDAEVFSQQEYEQLAAVDPDVDLDHGRRSRAFVEAVIQRYPNSWKAILGKESF